MTVNSHSIIRNAARAAIVTAVLAVGLSGVTAAHAAPDPDINLQDFVSEAADLTATGGTRAFSLGEIGGTGIASGVANLRGASKKTDVRFTLRPAYRVTVGGRTSFIQRLSDPATVVVGTVPAMAGNSTAEAFAVPTRSTGGDSLT